LQLSNFVITGFNNGVLGLNVDASLADTENDTNIGFYGEYDPDNVALVKSGLIRQKTGGDFVLFDGVTAAINDTSADITGLAGYTAANLTLGVLTLIK